MILYKYMSFATCRRVMEGNTLSFSDPHFFNDPFDMPFLSHRFPVDWAEKFIDPGGGALAAALGLLMVVAKSYEITKTNIADAQKWADSIGILSLTRTPTNPLMWSHYADHHKGVVLGIDARAARFTDERTNLVPAQYGSVIYTSRRPDYDYVERPGRSLSAEKDFGFSRDHYEFLQRFLLQKSLAWSYEEEVRVVKNVHGAAADPSDLPSGRLSQLSHPTGKVFLFSLPPDAIRELYFGCRVDKAAADALVAEFALRTRPKLSLQRCELNKTTYSIRMEPYSVEKS